MGNLRVVLAVGSQHQVAILARYRQTGADHPGMRPPDDTVDELSSLSRAQVSFKTTGPRTVEEGAADVTPASETAARHAHSDEESRSTLTQHCIDIAVESASNLQLFDHALYGETDCFVEYKFPQTDFEAVHGRLVNRARMAAEGEPAAGELDPVGFVIGPRQAHR